MKRWTDNGCSLDPDADGEWIRYSDHVEAMKRIAGDSGQKADDEDEEGGPIGDQRLIEWDKFPGWLIDHCEGDTITEELLQHALADMLKVHPPIAAPAPASPAALTDGCTEENCQRCRTPQELRTPELRHAGIGSYPVDKDEPSASPDALTDERVFDLVGEVLGQPLIVEDLRQGFAVHTEPRDWLNFARALLAASPADQEGWQPIETAPKDGTVIDLWVGGDHRRTSCYWGLPHHCCGEMGSYCDSEWHDLVEGWVDDLNEPLGVFTAPTHWMPLPPAPAMSASKEGS